jgi:prolyl-tRNA synthetase
MIDVYKKYSYEEAVVPAVVGRKSKVETFAGGACTYTIEAMMGHKKALHLERATVLAKTFLVPLEHRS